MASAGRAGQTFRTHAVTNQAPPMPDRDAYAQDAALVEAVGRFTGAGHDHRLHELGERAGDPSWHEVGMEANRDLPRLRTHDRYGNRVDEVAFGPAWHELMRSAVTWGLHADPWVGGVPGAHAARAAGFVLWTQVEPGHLCPISMTYAVIPALRRDPALLEQWAPGLTARAYDFGLRPAQQKAGLVAGMAMTEKQGGSDVRSNSTFAVPTDAGMHVLTGHKWFCSAPMSDLFLVLAQAPGGLTCFVVPRVLADGSRNPLAIQRLKDKLGNRSNASSEIELPGTLGWRLGPEGRGVRTIVEMVSATRLDCVLGACGLMRGALSRALWHAQHRVAFGAVLADQPLMRNVLADMAVEVEASIALALRLAHAVDRAEAGDEAQSLLRRIALPAAKLWTTKRSIAVTAEALECLGGNGYAEESGMPLYLREAPVNSVWEGSGNVNALDLLRALEREPGTRDALFGELGLAGGADARFDRAVRELADQLADPEPAQFQARRLAASIAVLLQGAQLIKYGPGPVADAFVATRIAGDNPILGCLPRGCDTSAILARATPCG